MAARRRSGGPGARRTAAFWTRSTRSCAAAAGTLGAGDRTTVSDYVDSVREVERRIQTRREARRRPELPALERPLRHSGAVRRARQADVRPAVARLPGRHHARRDVHARSRAELPNLSRDRHHRGAPRAVAPSATGRNSSSEVCEGEYLSGAAVRRFLEKLRATPDGDGTLLDHSMFLYGAGLSNPNLHAHTDLPLAVFGGGIKGGRHIVSPRDTPMTNLLLTMLDKAASPRRRSATAREGRSSATAEETPNDDAWDSSRRCGAARCHQRAWCGRGLMGPPCSRPCRAATAPASAASCRRSHPNEAEQDGTTPLHLAVHARPSNRRSRC